MQAIKILDSYGLSRDDFMENLKEMQFIIDKDKVFKGKFLEAIFLVESR